MYITLCTNEIFKFGGRYASKYCRKVFWVMVTGARTNGNMGGVIKIPMSNELMQF